MNGTIVHLIGGDCAGAALAKAGLPGEVFVWHDVLYDGPRNPGWPSAATLEARARFLEETTGGGLERGRILETLKRQYERVARAAADGTPVVLWFDACLFDMAMLAHLVTVLRLKGAQAVEWLVIDACPGVEPYDGLGQLTPAQLAAAYGRRRPVTPEVAALAERADRAFALQDPAELEALAVLGNTAWPWLSAAARRRLEERPDPKTGLGRLARLALESVRAGNGAPVDIMKDVSRRDGHPLFWGDTTLWARLNRLADRGLVRIDGPTARLPQWEGGPPLDRFRVMPG